LKKVENLGTDAFRFNPGKLVDDINRFLPFTMRLPKIIPEEVDTNENLAVPDAIPNTLANARKSP
jgi:hypothetical protein